MWRLRGRYGVRVEIAASIRRPMVENTGGGFCTSAMIRVSTKCIMDPRDPRVLYASAYQRRRRVWTLINGGPESAIYKSTDAGATWRKLEHGLPSVDMGRIGLAISPVDPDVVYAIIEAAEDKGGFFRSTDRGETWTQAQRLHDTSPQYYNEIVCDPVEVDRVYALDTFLHVTNDGGESFQTRARG